MAIDRPEATAAAPAKAAAPAEDGARGAFLSREECELVRRGRKSRRAVVAEVVEAKPSFGQISQTKRPFGAGWNGIPAEKMAIVSALKKRNVPTSGLVDLTLWPASADVDISSATTGVSSQAATFCRPESKGRGWLVPKARDSCQNRTIRARRIQSERASGRHGTISSKHTASAMRYKFDSAQVDLAISRDESGRRSTPVGYSYASRTKNRSARASRAGCTLDASIQRGVFARILHECWDWQPAAVDLFRSVSVHRF